MSRNWSPLEVAAAVAVGGSLLAVAIPSFIKNLTFSKLNEPIMGLNRLVRNAVSYANEHPQNICFPPSAPLSPAQVPRGTAASDPPGTWQHLTWRSLGFSYDVPHYFAFKFESARDENSGVMRFVATAHGDLDGDGVLSTFEVRGQKAPESPAQVLPGMFVDREVE